MDVLRSVISASLIVSPFILLLLLTVPLTDKRYAPGGRCRIWLLLMAAFCVPLLTVLPEPVVQINMPLAVMAEPAPESADIPDSAVPDTTAADTITLREENASTTVNPIVLAKEEETNPVNPALPYLSSMAPASEITGGQNTVSLSGMIETVRTHLPALLPVLWLLGALVSLLLRLGSYLAFSRSVRRWSADITNERVLAAFEDARAGLGVRGKPGLKTCKKITSPILLGYFRPLILLPDASCPPEELALLLRHELAHYKRRDLWYKLALVTVTSLYWFHPLVYLMAAQAGRDLEAACDALTVQGMEMPLRKRYSEIILNAAFKPQLRPHPLTTHFFGGKYMLKKRFSHILGTSKKKGTALFAVTGSVILLITLLVGCSFTRLETPSDAENPPTQGPASPDKPLPGGDTPDDGAATDPNDTDGANGALPLTLNMQNNWNDYARNMELQYGSSGTKDWQECSEQLQEYARKLWDEFAKNAEELYGPPSDTDWLEHANQMRDAVNQAWSEFAGEMAQQYGELSINDWQEYSGKMREYAEQMQEYAREMEKWFNLEKLETSSREENEKRLRDLSERLQNASNERCYTLEELKAIVYDQSKPVEKQFDGITSLKLDIITENVKIIRGGDKLTIRYSEWYDDQYTLTSDNQTLKLSVENNNRMLKQGNSITGNWLPEVLKAKGIMTEFFIELLIPESMTPDRIDIDTVSGRLELSGIAAQRLDIDDVDAQTFITDCRIDTITFDSVNGRSQISGTVFNTLSMDAVDIHSVIRLTDKAENYDIQSDECMDVTLSINGKNVKDARNKAAGKRITVDGISGSLTLTDG